MSRVWAQKTQARHRLMHAQAQLMHAQAQAYAIQGGHHSQHPWTDEVKPSLSIHELSLNVLAALFGEMWGEEPRPEHNCLTHRNGEER